MKRYKFEVIIPEDVKVIHRIFKEKGFELYMVGGCVRDSYLNLEIKDYDLSTNANPDVVQELMNCTSDGIKFHSIPIGESFGVISVNTSLDNTYEVATWRSDGKYNDSRRPDSVVFGSLEHDSQRRDFTINSLYYDIENGEVIDFNGGVEDLSNKLIKSVGNPYERFNEDLLRVLRAVRFANRYRFKLDTHLEAILNTKLTLNGVSKERIRSEFLATLKSAKNKQVAIEMLRRFGFMNQIFPNLHINLTKDRFFITSSPMVIIARMLRHNSIKKIEDELNKLTYGKGEIKVITFLISLLIFKDEDILKFKKKLNSINILVSDIKKFAKINRLSEKLIKGLLLYELQINGEDVKKEFGLDGFDLGVKINELEIESFKKFIQNGFK